MHTIYMTVFIDGISDTGVALLIQPDTAEVKMDQNQCFFQSLPLPCSYNPSQKNNFCILELKIINFLCFLFEIKIRF